MFLRQYIFISTLTLFTLNIANAAIVPNPVPFKASIHSVPLQIRKKMRQSTWKPNCPVPLRDLALVKLTYWGFDHKAHQGQLIVYKKLAPQVVAIFKKLYQQHYPIQQMQLMYRFNGNDVASMQANNTSAFNCRPVTGYHNVFSQHSYGRAIDINPLINPYIKNGKVLPKNGHRYLDRHLHVPGMITHQSQIYQDFIRLGWRWGGDWQHLKDYQHFEKPAV